MKRVKTTLAISTYNWPQALKLCLLSVTRQKLLPDEVIVADDGSADTTRVLIEQFQKDFPVPLKHIWQPDEGFQLSKIRNRAIAAASHEYIIQIDGDLILHPYFVADHVAFSKPQSFVSGSRVMLNEELSKKMLQNGSVDVNLLQGGITNKSNGLRIGFLRNYLSERYRIHDMLYLRGCNMAFWRDNLIKVNGFNESFTGWGREDNEIAVRLINSGIRKRIIKFGGVVYHIYHPVNSRSDLGRNDDMLNNAIQNKTTYCPLGLSQYL